MLTANEIRGVVAVMPTPAKEGADSILATDTVNLDETARLVEQVIRDGAASIMALGTTGECATLSDEDYKNFVDCLLSTVNGSIPTFVGTTALGTHKIAERIKFVKERGATATLLGIPMWQPATLEMAVQHYADISDAFPDFAIMVYANARAFRFPFGADFWEGIASRAPTVTSAKFSNLEILKEVWATTKGRVRFVPVDASALRAAKIEPEAVTALWSLAAGISPAIALIDAINDRDWERAEQVGQDIAWAGETTRELTKPEIFASFNIQLNRAVMDATGLVKLGPIRPPYGYKVMPQEYKDACQEAGRRWAQLEAKYAHSRAEAAKGWPQYRE